MMRAYVGSAAIRDQTRERLIAEHIDMARRIAIRVGRRIPPWLQEDDLIAAAMIGLAEAADRYDDTRGEPFVAFAEKRIRGAVLDELRRGDLLPRRMRTTARKVGETLRRLEHQLGRPPEDEETAAAMGVSIEEFREEMEMLTHVSFVDIDNTSDGESGMTSPIAQSPAVIAERSELVGRLQECLHKLPERDALVLSLYYVEEFGYAEIGEVLGVSESRVCQLHSRALARLRAEFESDE